MSKSISNTILLCFIDPRARKIKNEASNCPGIFSRTLCFYYVPSSPGFCVTVRESLTIQTLVQKQTKKDSENSDAKKKCPEAKPGLTLTSPKNHVSSTTKGRSAPL